MKRPWGFSVGYTDRQLLDKIARNRIGAIAISFRMTYGLVWSLYHIPRRLFYTLLTINTCKEYRLLAFR